MEYPKSYLPYEERLSEAGNTIKRWLLNNDIVFNEAMGPLFEESINDIKIKLAPLDSIKKSYLNNPEDQLTGDCRTVAAGLAGKLEGICLVDEAKIYIDKEFGHYVVVGKINDRLILFDIARRRPVEVPIPVNDDAVYSSFYSDIDTQMYLAAGNEEHIDFTISDMSGKARRHHEYKKLKSQEDDIETWKKILENHTRLTCAKFGPKGKFVKEDVTQTTGGKIRMQVHEILKAEGENIKIIIED